MARFNDGAMWRFVVTGVGGVALTNLERLAQNRALAFNLNQPAQFTCQVPSDDPRVFILRSDDTPYVSFNDRLVYGFRAEAGDWVCRYAGVIHQLEDTAQDDQPYSNLTAYDPWQLLYKRPVLDAEGTLPDHVTGQEWEATAGSEIALTLIERTIYYNGDAHIDIAAGTIEETSELTITFQPGTSVGEALDQLVATGTLDIIMRPVYDPEDGPGICCELNVYVQAGTERNAAVFSWDRGRSVSGISALYDGDQMANQIQFYNGQGGPPVTLQTDTDSTDHYGEWWAQQFFPAQTEQLAVEAMAAMQLLMRRWGRRTVTITPNPLLSPSPFLGYGLGDRVPVYATARLRQQIPRLFPAEPTVYQRIYGIPIALGDDGVEKIDRLLASPDGFA